MLISQNYRPGIILAMTSAAIAAICLTPYKLATQQLDTAAVVLLLLFFAAAYNTVISAPKWWFAFRRNKKGLTFSKSTTLKVGIVCAVLSALANYATGQTVALLNTAVTSLLIQTQVLIATAVAWLWLGERVTAGFIGGAIIAIAGVGLMRALGGDIENAVTGTLWGVLAAASFGLTQVITRRFILRLEPMMFNTIRLWLSVLLLALIPGSLAAAFSTSSEVIGLIALSALGGPFLGRVALIYSARYIPAAMSSLMGLAGPVFAMSTEWLFIGSLPTSFELIGGMLVIVGMAFAIKASFK